jgi:preprotein translocase subunit SecD
MAPRELLRRRPPIGHRSCDNLVNLGVLDLRGGAQLLAEVKVEQVYEQRMRATWPEVRDV